MGDTLQGIDLLEVAHALEVLKRAGFSLSEPVRPFRSVTIAEAAERLACSQDWVRDNLAEFRGAWRLGSAIRLPEEDLEAVARRRRIFSGSQGGQA